MAKSLQTDGILREIRSIVQRHLKQEEAENQPKVSKISALLKKTKKEDDKQQEDHAKAQNSAAECRIDGLRVLSDVVKLFRALASTSPDALVLKEEPVREGNVTKKPTLVLRYFKLTLDPDLRAVIGEARAFVMVGGTMRPVGFLAGALKKLCGLSEVLERHFPHVIQPRRIMPLIISELF